MTPSRKRVTKLDRYDWLMLRLRRGGFGYGVDIGSYEIIGINSFMRLENQTVEQAIDVAIRAERRKG